jgi:hypothetical protein
MSPHRNSSIEIIQKSTLTANISLREDCLITPVYYTRFIGIKDAIEVAREAVALFHELFSSEVIAQVRSPPSPILGLLCRIDTQECRLR